MTQFNYTFIVKMRYVFQKEYNLYFVMDYIKGEDLFVNLKLVKRFNEN